MALKSFLTKIADAIRKKNGTTETINAQDFVSKIEDASAKEKVMLGAVTKQDLNVTFDGNDFKGLTSIGGYLFYGRPVGIDKIIIPDLDENGNGIKTLGSRSFGAMFYPHSMNDYDNAKCSIIVGNGVTVIPDGCFYYCCAKYLEFRGDITEIKTQGLMAAPVAAFGNSKPGVIKMTNCTSVPILSNSNMFSQTTVGTKIVVPDVLYDEWIVATNWNAISTNVTIIKNSDYEAALVAEVTE